MARQVDVLIAGAGPAGSSAAIHLARAGFDVLMVDRCKFPRDKACSEYMSPEAVRLLDRLGVVADLEAAGCSVPHGTAVTGAGGSRLIGRFAQASVVPFRPTGLSVARKILDQRLVEAARAAGARVREGTTIEELLYDDGSVAGAVVCDAEGAREPIRARLTIGADGLRSVVARRIGRRRYGAPARIAFVGHLQQVDGMGDLAELHVSRNGYVGLNPIGRAWASGEPITNVALVVPRARVAAARGRVEAFFYEELERFPGVRGRLRADRLVRRVLVTGPFAAWSGRVITDGALLTGDAADFFDPFTGEGIYSALRGGELIAAAAPSALQQRGRVGAAALRPYAIARRQAFMGKWAVERLIGYGMLLPALFDRAIARLERRGMAHTLIGVTGDFVPAAEVLHPLFLARMVF